jgi:hypothetical protein
VCVAFVRDRDRPWLIDRHQLVCITPAHTDSSNSSLKLPEQGEAYLAAVELDNDTILKTIRCKVAVVTSNSTMQYRGRFMPNFHGEHRLQMKSRLYVLKFSASQSQA